MWFHTVRAWCLVVLFGSLAGIVQPASAKETDTAEPIQGISASVQPDLFTGVLTTSVPLIVPPGRHGMQPTLALTYESSGGVHAHPISDSLFVSGGSTQNTARSASCSWSQKTMISAIAAAN